MQQSGIGGACDAGQTATVTRVHVPIIHKQVMHLTGRERALQMSGDTVESVERMYAANPPNASRRTRQRKRRASESEMLQIIGETNEGSRLNVSSLRT
jgi:hypothetical protein